MARTYSADKSGTLFDYIKTKKKLKREGDLARFLGEHASIISEVRNGKREVSAELLMRICEKTGMGVKSAKAMIDAKSAT